jgi:hypothetical protein
MSTGEEPHWFGFDPVLVLAATKRAEVHDACRNSISSNEWEQLEKALAELPEHKQGLYPIGWQPQEGALEKC